MDYTNPTADFAKRTLQNLNYVQEGALRGEAGVYEVTQLWNSLLGLIVLPHERVINRLPMIPMNELSPLGWPLLITTAGDEPPSVQALVRCLRNAVAHFNFEFNAGTDGEIASATMWNANPRSPHSRVWEGVITMRELEHLARLLANTYILGSSQLRV